MNFPVATELSHVAIDTAALRHNVSVLGRAATTSGHKPLVCAMVKGNAYGHGLVVAARAFIDAGVDWLGIGEIHEAIALQKAGIDAPTFAVCHIPEEQAAAAVAHNVRLTVYDAAVVSALAAAARTQSTIAKVHLKVETGTNRQGLREQEAVQLARRIATDPNLLLEGISTHFADIEDTTDHRFARAQLGRFRDIVGAIKAAIARDTPAPRNELLTHASNTAAVLLWPDVCPDLVRFGIGAYGMWPSKETRVSASQLGRGDLELRPAFHWKTRIVQLKDVPVGEWVGYGRSFRTVRPTHIGILPVGYYDGYDRGLSNLAEVLVSGQRARVVGRVAMNMVAIDVTDNTNAERGSEVVLLGHQSGEAGADTITAAEMAGWLGTIHYEVTTRVHPRLPRIAT